MKHSIIIPTYRDRDNEDIVKLVSEIETMSTGEYELIVTCQKASAAINRNYGLNNSNNDLVIMIDDDIRSLPYGWNEEIIRLLVEDENIKIVSARLMAEDGRLGLNMGNNYDVSSDVVEVESGYVPTACIAFKKEDDIRFDETYIGSGFEDTDFMNQMMKKYPNSKHVINNLVKLIHINEMKEQRGENWEKNKAYFMNKWKNFIGRKQVVRRKLEEKKISLCMIVKNEEENLPRCLNSVKGLVDEIIIVDTGSTDQTKLIAKRMGAQVYDFPWNNSFADARNESIKHATGDWILIMDADEEVNTGTRLSLQQLANNPIKRPVNYLIQIGNILDDGGIVETRMSRFFPNNKNIIFEGPIHEALKINGQDFMTLATDLFTLKHYGYSKQFVTERNKMERNISALEAEVEKDPNNAYYRYHLASSYVVAKELDKAINEFGLWEKIIENLDGIDVSMGISAYIGTLAQLERYEEAIVIGKKYKEKSSFNPDFCLNYGGVLSKVKNFIEAEEMLTKAILIGKQQAPIKTSSYDKDSMGWKPMYLLGDIYAQQGKNIQAIEIWKQASVIRPTPELYKAISNACMMTQKYEDGVNYIKTMWELWPQTKNTQDVINMANIYLQINKIPLAIELLLSLPDGKKHVDSLLIYLSEQCAYDLIETIETFIIENFKDVFPEYT